MVKRERAKEEKFEQMMEVLFFVCYEFFFNVDGQSAALEKISLATKKKNQIERRAHKRGFHLREEN